MNVTAIVLLASGTVLMYAAVKGKDPRDVVRSSLKLPPKHQSLIPNNIAPIQGMGSITPGTAPGQTIVSN